MVWCYIKGMPYPTQWYLIKDIPLLVICNRHSISLPGYSIFVAVGVQPSLLTGMHSHGNHVPSFLSRRHNSSCMYKQIYTQEGMSGFYRGIVPNLTRQLLPAGLVFYVVETVRTHLQFIALQGGGGC